MIFRLVYTSKMLNIKTISYYERRNKMKVTLTNNVLTINTGIKAEVLGDRTFTTSNEEEQEVMYAVNQNTVGAGRINSFSITTNSVDDEGFAVFVEVLPTDITLEQVKDMYGDYLITAEKYIPVILQEATERAVIINRLFAE